VPSRHKREVQKADEPYSGGQLAPSVLPRRETRYELCRALGGSQGRVRPGTNCVGHWVGPRAGRDPVPIVQGNGCVPGPGETRYQLYRAMGGSQGRERPRYQLCRAMGGSQGRERPGTNCAGQWVDPRAGRDPVPIVQDPGWVPGAVWRDAENFAATAVRIRDCPARIEQL
jgi:hypothetical protein